MERSESDLAAECGVSEGNGIRIQRAQARGCEILRIRIESEQASARIGKPRGRYVTVDCGNVCKMEKREVEEVCSAVAVEIREMVRRLCKKQIGVDFTVLVVGLGNAGMTADALGVRTVESLCVTRHLPPEARDVLCGSGCGIAAFSPGVPGQTGMESAELVKGVVHALQPDLVVAVDALAARSPSRLAGTVQLCDSGIQPGSGVGQARHALTQGTLGVPVLAIGVPTVIRCGTLIADVLGKERERDVSVCESVRELRVCPGEIDLVVRCAGQLLASALEKAFCTQKEA